MGSSVTRLESPPFFARFGCREPILDEARSLQARGRDPTVAPHPVETSISRFGACADFQYVAQSAPAGELTPSPCRDLRTGVRGMRGLPVRCVTSAGGARITPSPWGEGRGEGEVFTVPVYLRALVRVKQSSPMGLARPGHLANRSSRFPWRGGVGVGSYRHTAFFDAFLSVLARTWARPRCAIVRTSAAC